MVFCRQWRVIAQGSMIQIELQLIEMYFGLNPFGIHFGFNQQQQLPQQPQQNGGLFAGFTNFIHNNFMNPHFPHARQQQQQERAESPRPTFSRRNGRVVPQEKPDKKEEVKEGSGLFWKLKGNEAYQRGHWQNAVLCYSNAIDADPSQSIYFSNRAQSLKKMGKLELALKDAQEAVEIDPANIRGHLLCGQTLAELGKQEDSVRKVQNGITRLTKALTLNGGKKIELEKEISRYIYLAKKLLFYLRFQEVRNSRIRAAEEYKAYLDKDEKLTMDAKEFKMKGFLEASNEQPVFSIPDYLTCRITLELMEDPVTTDSGQTYQREAIEQHLEKNGRTDPFTRQPIKGPVYPNVAIRKAVQDFLQRNPWAYEYTENENYKDISF